ncbi:ferredoxin [Haliea atlantica]
MKVHVDLNKCQGHARCEEICPEVFATDEVEGKAVILQENVPEAHRENTILAVQNCPEYALSLSEE